jgi:hypothetical protein
MLNDFLLSVLHFIITNTNTLTGHNKPKPPQDLIDTDVRPRKKGLHIIAMKRMRQAVITLLLYRLLREAVIFCVFKKMQELMTAKTGHQEELLVCKRK